MATIIKHQCDHCKSFFSRKLRDENINKKRNQTHNFCSQFCKHKFYSAKIQINLKCLNCDILFKCNKNRNRKFCCQKCSAIASNKNKKIGTRVSKLELWLQKELQTKCPQIQFHFNRRDAINGELDIYIPSLKLAFEINGIFHYEPIYGKEKLNQIQNNDNRKFQACLEHNIELAIIDSSQLIYFKEQKAKQYFNIISDIINNKIVAGQEIAS